MAIPWSRLPDGQAGRTREAAVVGEIRADGDVPRSRRSRPASARPGIPWPYVEGLTIAEATNELAFLVTGAYGKPVPKQMGAPIRLAVPWKYGFKSIKSIVRFSFTDQRPKSYWESLQGGEYGFWANVNPEVLASALEPGDRGADRHQRAAADAAVQRLRRLRRRSLQGHGEGAALGVTEACVRSGGLAFSAFTRVCRRAMRIRRRSSARRGYGAWVRAAIAAVTRAERANPLYKRCYRCARRDGSADWSSSRSPWRSRWSGPTRSRRCCRARSRA